MKWKDLSLKERKQIYDSVRANNPDATYFDIKEQFDSIPTYEDGKGKTIKQIYHQNIELVLLNTLKDKGKYQVQLMQFNQKLILLQLVILKMQLTSLKI